VRQALGLFALLAYIAFQLPAYVQLPNWGIGRKAGPSAVAYCRDDVPHSVLIGRGGTGTSLCICRLSVNPAVKPQRRDQMNRVGILATLQARPGKEIKVEEFLKSATPLVAAEVGTTAWFAFKIGPATFGIFDTFNDQQGRSAHVNGEVAKALFARAEELFVTAPQIQMVDIVAEKL
jgi:quinol monooxygenase YgiN